MPLASDILVALRQPVEALFDPAERIYWLFLLTPVVLVWLVLGVRRGSRALRRGLLSGRIWTHPSARADVTMMFAKALVGMLTRIPWLAATAGGALWLGITLSKVLGPADVPAWDRTTIAVVYSVVLFVAWDFGRFVLHWLLHRIPFLWSFHQVHHSAEVLEPLTLYRTHPVETFLYDLRGLVTTATVTGVFLYLFRGTASEIQLLGINALGFVFNAAGANLRHSHVWLRFGRLERWLLSPAQHQLHHGRDLADQQSNYGTWLAVWDRLLGTWRPAPPTPPQRYGLDDANHRYDSVASMLVGPVVAAGAMLFGPRRRWLWSAAALVGLSVAPRKAAGAQASAPGADDTVEMSDAAPSPDDPRTVAPIDPPTWPEDGPGDPADREAPPDAGAPSPSEEATTPPDDATATPSEGDDEVDFELDLEESAAATDPKTPTAGDDAPTEASDPKDYDVALDQISIIGTPEARATVGGSVHVIGEKELERKENDDIHRVLRDVPGVYTRGEDGFGLRPNIGMRGASSDRSAKITLMEDGILLAPAPYSAPAAYVFPLVTRISGVEVFKGPAALRHGPNTIGGALNLLTRPVPVEPKGYIDAGLGMRGYGKLHGWWGGSKKGFGMLIEGARVQSNGFKKLDGGGNTGFDRNDLMLKGRYASDPNRRWYHQVDLKGGFGTERSNETYLGLTDADFADTPYRRYAASQKGRMKWWRTQAEAGYFVARGTIFDLQLRGYRHDFHRAWRKFNNFRGVDIHQVLAAPDVGQTAVYHAILSGRENSITPDQTLMIGTNDRRFGVTGGTVVAHVRPTWRWLEQDIEVGARVHHDWIERNHTEDGYLMFNGTLVPEGTDTVTTARNVGSALAGAFHLVDTLRIAWFSVMPGARVEVIRTEFEDRLDGTESSAVDTVFLPGIGAHAQATPWLGILAGVHSGFSPVSPGQPEEVEPEKSINYEAGARVDHRGRRTHTRAEAIGFFNDYSNLTSVCTFSSGCDDTMLDRQFNAGRVFVYGVESLVSERVEIVKGHWVEGSAAYTYTGSSFRTGFSSESPLLGDVSRGDQLPYVPVHLASFNLGVGGRIWGIWGSGVVVGDMRDVAGQGTIPDEERIPRHFVIDLAGQVAPTQRSLLYLTIQNLTNNAYMVSRRPYGVRPGMPFQLMVGFKYHFF